MRLLCLLLIGSVLVSSCKTTRPLLPEFQTQTFEASVAPSAQEEYVYRIETGDRLLIRNLNWLSPLLPEPTADQGGNDRGYEVTVSPAGSIRLPEIGEIQVARLTRTQLEDTLAARYRNVLNNPLFEVVITNHRVEVMGAVTIQGSLPLLEVPQSLGAVLARAGGIDFQRSAGTVQIIRGDGTSQRIITFDVETLADPRVLRQPIYHKDVVYVPVSKEVIRTARWQRALVYVQPVIALLNIAFLVINVLR